jgi:aromatic-L-amino-acid decarboxylase
MTRYPLEPDARSFAHLTEACVAFVRDHLASIDRQPASYLEDSSDLRRTFREPLPESGHAIEAILARLAPAIAMSFNTAGPGYFGFIPGGGIYSAALADFVALATNRYVGVVRAAPALAEIEMQVVRWLASLVGFGPEAGGVLTSGGSMANLIAVVAARTERLGEHFQHGMIYTSRETHLSVAKAARVAGFPAANVRVVPVDGRYRIDLAALQSAIASDVAAGAAPFLVVANAGSTNVGAIDPIPEIVAIARAHGLWVHADAAYGGFFRLVPEGAARLRGLEECDSVTLDPHKGLFLPYGTGCLVVRDPSALRRANAVDADYLRDVASEGDLVNFSDVSPELSRDFRGLRLWLPLQLHGVRAFRAQIAEKLALARLAYERLRADARFEVLDEPQLSVVAFRLARGGDAANRELLERTNGGQRAFLSSTVLDGKLTLRLCVLSFRSHEDRVREAIEALRLGASAIEGDSSHC